MFWSLAAHTVTSDSVIVPVYGVRLWIATVSSVALSSVMIRGDGGAELGREIEEREGEDPRVSRRADGKCTIFPGIIGGKKECMYFQYST